jgi:hypothetical protein
MDLFKVFPSLNTVQHTALNKRNLRLISVSGLVFDDEALYLEISPAKYWTKLPEGTDVIGIGLPKVEPDDIHPPHQALIQYLRGVWHCETNLYLPGYAVMMDEEKNVSLIPDVEFPFFLHMTKPRLGGSLLPDALVQALFLLPIKTFSWQKTRSRVDLIRIQRDYFSNFMAQEVWSIDNLLIQPWCDYKGNKALPQDGAIRTVLILRGLRELFQADQMDTNFLIPRSLN